MSSSGGIAGLGRFLGTNATTESALMLENIIKNGQHAIFIKAVFAA
jgi:hypothetical protein